MVGGATEPKRQRAGDRDRAPFAARPSPAQRLAAAWSLPPWLASRWVAELGAPTALRLGRAMAGAGRVTLRANALRTTRARLLERIAAQGVRAVPGGGGGAQLSEVPSGVGLRGRPGAASSPRPPRSRHT